MHTPCLIRQSRFPNIDLPFSRLPRFIILYNNKILIFKIIIYIKYYNISLINLFLLISLIIIKD
jgi:hypothetical protein